MRYKCMHWNVVALQLYWHNLYESVCYIFLLLDKDELIITDAFLHNLLSLTKHSDLKCLISLQIGQRGADGGWKWTNIANVTLIFTFNETTWQTLKHVHRCKRPVAQKPIHKHQRTSTIPPVALAMRLRSLLRTLLTAMAPTSTKYLRHMSSMPPVVRITLAPDAKIFWILSLVMSDSLDQQNPILFQFHQQYLNKIQCQYNTELSSPQWWYNSSDRSCCLDSGCWYFLPRASLCKLLVQHHSKFKWDNS